MTGPCGDSLRSSGLRLDIDQERAARAFGLQRAARAKFFEDIKALRPGRFFVQQPLDLRTPQDFRRAPLHLGPRHSLAVALIDRIVRYADVIAIEGDSYRKREAEAGVTARKKHPGS